MKHALSLKPDSVRDRLLAALRESLSKDARKLELDRSRSLRELGLDSLAIVMLVARFCETEGIALDAIDADVSTLRTVGDLIDAGERILVAGSRDAS